MAKFIIGILRKRLPVLKFRCALLKPSAAIELTNQADNLGLTKAVKLRHIPAQNKGGESDKKLSDSENGSSGCAASHIVDSESENNSNIGKIVVGPVETPVVSSEESGMDELSSSNNQTESNVSSSSSCNESEPENNSSQNSENSSNGNQENNTPSNDSNNQRFVT